MKRLMRAFAAEDGAIMPMVVMLFLTMVVMAGMGVDFMRHEAARADLQNALDRGVLAATARTQTLAQREEGMSDEELLAAKEELIRSYMRARTFSLAEPEINVSIPDDLAEYETAVAASASYDMDTFFLKVAGFGRMGVPADSYAEQRRLDIEVSLVLDVSGSMLSDSAVLTDPENTSGGYKTKIRAVKDAAKDFVSTLLTNQEEGQTLVSIVPYSSSVSANAFMAQHYGLLPVTNFLALHGYSFCFEFSTDGSGADGTVLANPDYTTVPIKREFGTHQHRQMQHFANINQAQADYYFGGDSRYDCPVPNNRILPFSNDAGDLTSMIESMEAENYTATYAGVKWGAALLDPSSQSLVTAMIDAGATTDTRSTETLSSDYDGWPQEYSANNVHKYLIIFSDGRNTSLRRYTDDSVYYTPSEPATTAELVEEQAGRMQYWNESWRWDGRPEPSTVVNSTEGDELNKLICDSLKTAAGDGNLTIFTIGYDISTTSTSGQAAISVLRHCATNPDTDFFSITGGDNPATAFNEIQARLSLLKLAQSRR